jgi:predicted permease
MRRALARLRALFRHAAVDDEIREELDGHLALETERLIAAGMAPREAGLAARRAIGNLTTHAESMRDAYGWLWLDQLWQDLRYACRTLLRVPVFTVAAVLTLAIAIGANSAIFSAIDAFLLRPLPVGQPERLVTLEQAGARGGRFGNYAFPDYEAFAKLDDVFTGVSATTWADGFNVTLAGESDPPDAIGAARVSIVTGNYFSVFRAGIQAGRAFTTDDDRDGAAPVVVISDGYWARRFHRDRSVIGRTLTMLGTSYTVVGIGAPHFEGEWVGWPADIWVPVANVYRVLAFLAPGSRGGRMQFKLVARLRDGVTIERAEAVGEITYRRLAEARAPGSGVDRQMHFSLVPAGTGYSTSRIDFKRPLYLLMGIVGAVLLIACANVANLLLARAASRERELGVRLAIGASRGRVVRQLLAEHLLLGVLGATAGLAVAAIGARALGQMTRSGPPTSVLWGSPSVVLDLSLNWRVTAFTAGVSLLAVAMFGLVPAIRGSRIPVGPSVIGVRRVRREGNWLRGGLVVGQVTLTVVLMTAAALFVRSMSNLKGEDLGFDRSRLALVWTVPGYKEGTRAAIESRLADIQDRLASIPGVRSVSASQNGVLSGSPGGSPWFRREGADSASAFVADDHMFVGPRFFATIGQRLIAGREFTPLDLESAPRVVIVDESFARRMFGEAHAVGRRILIGRTASAIPAEIVGVVADARFATPKFGHGVVAYSPYMQARSTRRLALLVALSEPPARFLGRIRQVIQEADALLPILEIDTAEQQLDRALFTDRMVMRLAFVFGLVALLLASIGLFGVISFVTARRTGEIGVRIALGATRPVIARMVIQQSLTLVAAGSLLGAAGVWAARRVVGAQLYGISAVDPLTVAGVITAFAAVAVVATWLPAWRAARTDPLIAMRVE